DEIRTERLLVRRLGEIVESSALETGWVAQPEQTDHYRLRGSLHRRIKGRRRGDRELHQRGTARFGNGTRRGSRGRRRPSAAARYEQCQARGQAQGGRRSDDAQLSLRLDSRRGTLPEQALQCQRRVRSFFSF